MVVVDVWLVATACVAVTGGSAPCRDSKPLADVPRRAAPAATGAGEVRLAPAARERGRAEGAATGVAAVGEDASARRDDGSAGRRPGDPPSAARGRRLLQYEEPVALDDTPEATIWGIQGDSLLADLITLWALVFAVGGLIFLAVHCKTAPRAREEHREE